MALAMTLMLLWGCTVPVEKRTQTAKPGQVTTRNGKDAAEQKRIVAPPKRWVYWLQGVDPQSIASSASDLAVVDYSVDGTDAGAFTRADVALMQRGGRRVLCYFSIGEAESYRFYWNKAWRDAPPPFMGAENPDWPENYKVRYWHEQWWDMALRPYLDRIVDAGFDGVYLDIVDAYWFWHAEGGRDLSTSASEMIRLVARIATYLRERGGPNKIVCPQNAEGIFNDAPEDAVARYMRHIDMIGVESLLFNVTPEDSAYRSGILHRVSEAGKPVLNIEYIPLSQMGEYRAKMAALPFPILPYRGEPDAALNSLAVQ
ncbi:MJ1477/TM1410 family putative glycoside hydrolase [Desulfovibrio psychrotolerans]|uniref:Glycoside-hydrolase family GH114 TIM-barrel domain-containing protein n=1 Tax=Desulfovibrio psychrotolerans TaxID=415242 RepID=A0A7J0BQ74_9BACT|nr:MJ1477/TM1410 family putative glycoside hydrolase [Desulfovibrio psychrotolerans]GFM35332.1 hypothetical protein DSM19430T_00160 [Desulfovibrio psychrotolerans]